MKTKIYGLLMASFLIPLGCDPIEDTSLRNKYFENAGTPISVEELNAALSVTQPIPNSDNAIAGDQYVVVDNKRPDIGGTWRVGTSTGEKIVGTNHDTIIYTSNGSFDLYYAGISANQIVKSKTFTVEVTNCFDDYDKLLSGAQNKADVNAKKTWKLFGTYAVYNGMYGNWKYYDERGLNPTNAINNYGDGPTSSTYKDQTLVFEFSGHKMTTFSNTGAVVGTGSWAYTHASKEEIAGELVTTVSIPGQPLSWFLFSGVTTPYWIIRISNSELVLCLPEVYGLSPGEEDWDWCGTYFFFEPVE